eukprot:2517_1
MNEQKLDINTNVFQNIDRKCNGYNDCCYIKRIMTALSYYNRVSSEQPQIFIDFCDKYYAKKYLEDYIHFICIHKNDINKGKIKNTKCSSVTGCLSTTRHYRDRANDVKKDNVDTPRMYLDVFDSLHFYIYHMEECGLRVSISKHNNNDDIKKNNNDDSNFKDEVIAAIQKEIEDKKLKCGLFKRLDNTKNSKFNIMQISNAHET